MQVLNRKTGGATDRAQNIMLLRQMDEEWTPIKLKTWASKTISGCIEARVWGEQVHLGPFASIRYRVFWEGKKTVIHWGLFPVGGKIEPWVINSDVISASGYVRWHILNKERFHLWYCPADI